VKRKSRLGAIRSLGPAAKRGGIGQVVRVFKRRTRFFPGTMPLKSALQCLTARQQTVVRVRERKQRKKGERLFATRAATAADPNPVVMRIVRLLAAVSMADDRIALTNRASPQDDFGAARGPIRFKLVRRDRKWDKQNRSSLELCPPALTRQDLGRKRSSFLPEGKNPTGREYSFSAIAF
jgi:hypothetical protein